MASDYLDLPKTGANGMKLLTPSDTVPLDPISIGLKVEVGGTVKLTMRDGSVASPYLDIGYHPLHVKLVWATGTDAGVKIYNLYT